MSIFRPHRHRWTVIAAQRGVLTPFGPFGEGDVTMILYRCECGKVKDDQIDGHWTFEQVAGRKP